MTENYLNSYLKYPVVVNILVGMGLGMLMTYPIAGIHPVRWGVSLVVVGVLAQLVPLILK